MKPAFVKYRYFAMVLMQLPHKLIWFRDLVANLTPGVQRRI